MTYLFRRARDAAALSALLALGLAPTAFAGGTPTNPTTATAITSPADPYFSYFDVAADESSDAPDADADGTPDVNELTIRGTANSNEDLDIRCVYSDYGDGGRNYYYVADVFGEDMQATANGFTWSVEADKEDLVVDNNETEGDQACKLQAIPDSAEFYDDDLTAFAGPLVGMGVVTGATSDGFDRSARAGLAEFGERAARSHEDYPYDYYAAFPQARGFFAYTPAGDEGIDYSNPFAPGNLLQPTDIAWRRGADLDDSGGFDDRSQLLVDGQDGFTSYDSPDGFSQCCWSFEEIEGQPSIGFEIEQFDASTGNVTFLETSDIVHCDPSDVNNDDDGVDEYENGNPNADNCEQLVPSGLRLERRVTQDRQGRVSTIDDSFVSIEDADGVVREHNVDAQYDNATDHDTNPVWKAPGASSYSNFGGLDSVDLPDGPIGTFYGRDSYYNDNPDDTAGPVSLTYKQRPDVAVFDGGDRPVLVYRRQVPSGGSATIGHVYGQAFDRAEIEALGASVEDRLGGGPAVDITSPADGSTVSSSRVTVSGTAADNRGLDLLKVNGRAVTVHSDGTWSTELDLAEGANAITAEARDGEGQTATDSTTVTYAKPAAPQPQVIVQQVQVPVEQQEQSRSKSGRGVAAVQLASKKARLKGRRIRMSVRCAPGEPQMGTLKVRTAEKQKSKRRTLDTAVFQCPGGAKRNVSFVLSQRQAKLLRRKKSHKLNVFMVGRDLAGDTSVFRSSLTLRTR